MSSTLTDHEISQSKQVDKLFAGYTRGKQPGCAVAVVTDGRTVHAAAYGYASLDYDIPLTINSKFRIASVSKQFTAAALAIAEEDGLLSLDDPIGRYLPTLHSRTRQIPLRYFIAHTAGFKGFEHSLSGIATGVNGKPVNFGSDDYLSADELFDLSRSVAPETEPGARFEYSNMGYFWLGRVIERVSGESLRSYVNRKLLVPAGMHNSFLNDDARAIVGNMAAGFEAVVRPDGKRSTFEFRHYDNNLDWVGANGLVTNISDFLLWDQQFTHPTLGQYPEALRKRLTTGLTSIDGDNRTADAYAFGLFLENEDRYGPSVYHRGSWTAFRSIYKRYPDRNFAFAVFCNRPDVNRDAVELAIEDIYLE